PRMSERTYLAPQNQVTGDLRTTVGDPTPTTLGGFLIAHYPTIFSIPGSTGFDHGGAATVGTYFSSGGMLAIIASVMEWIIEVHAILQVFFGVFGEYFLSFSATISPSSDAYAAYASDASGPATNFTSPGFLSGIGRQPNRYGSGSHAADNPRPSEPS
ncbi:hypothetical protein DOTSEDRAFT_139228, partial [Dothistroma septosporum NZE10]